MSDLTRIASSRDQQSRIAIIELSAMATIIVLLVALHVVFIAKHTVTLNSAAESAAIGVIGP